MTEMDTLKIIEEEKELKEKLLNIQELKEKLSEEPKFLKIIEEEEFKVKEKLLNIQKRKENLPEIQKLEEKPKYIRLLVRLPQSGKTQIMLDEISDSIQNIDNPLSIVICDNSLLLTAQTYKRGKNQKLVNIGLISSNANGYCEWKSVKSYDNPSDKKLKETLEKRVKDNNVNTLVMCSNKTRWNDIQKLIDMFKSTHKIIIWIDEADKTVGGIDSITKESTIKNNQLNEWKNSVESINLITATPFTPKYNWNSHRWIGNNFNNIMELIKVPEIVGNNYHHLCNSNYYEQKTEQGESLCQYVKKYLDKNPASPGDIFLIPGTTRQQSHEDIKNMCLSDSMFDYVIILNGKTKSIQDADAIVYDNKHCETKSSLKSNEVSEWISKWYIENNINNKKFAITGNLCISRGITISSKICQITHMIFGSSSAIRDNDQLLSRLCGYCYTVDKVPIVVCDKNVWRDVSKYQEVVIELTKKAMTDNDRILTDEDLNIIIQGIDKNKRIPYMFEDLDMNKYENLFKPTILKKEKKPMVIEIIKDNNNSLYEFITNSKCKQITTPEESSSYKKHVEDVYKKYKENKNFVIDFTPEDKANDCWMCIIDKKNNRFFIIVWVVNSTVI